MQVDYQPCEDRLLVHEGSEYTDGVHPYDPGGPTRWGITLTDARLYWNPSATADDVRNMPKVVAQHIYKTKYWNALRCDELPAGFDDSAFDYGVNSGIARSGRVTRHLVGLPSTDWCITDEVIAAVHKRDTATLIRAMHDERLQFLRTLRIWPTYGHGWTTRVNEVENYDLILSSKQTPIPPQPNKDVQGSGKGHHAPPNKTKKTTIGGGAAATGAAGGTLHDWVFAHPWEAGLVVVGVATVTGIIVHELDKAHYARQTTPMPVPVVPAARAA